jgi:hypothetical protein
MKDHLSRYLDKIVTPTFEDFERNPFSMRHAFLACLVTYHAVDRMAYPQKSKTLVDKWRKKSFEFSLVEIVALQFKHVRSPDSGYPYPKGALRVTHALGLDETGETVELRSLYFLVRDAIKFLHKECLDDAT